MAGPWLSLTGPSFPGWFPRAGFHTESKAFSEKDKADCQPLALGGKHQADAVRPEGTIPEGSRRISYRTHTLVSKVTLGVTGREMAGHL